MGIRAFHPTLHAYCLLAICTEAPSSSSNICFQLHAAFTASCCNATFGHAILAARNDPELLSAIGQDAQGLALM